jgi:hypothetical protein
MTWPTRAAGFAASVWDFTTSATFYTTKWMIELEGTA